MLKKIIIATHVIIALCPLFLLAYHFKNWLMQGEVYLFPLAYALVQWFGVDVAIGSVSLSYENYHNFYMQIMRLPLLMWLFIVAVPSYIKIYKLTEEEVAKENA